MKAVEMNNKEKKRLETSGRAEKQEELKGVQQVGPEKDDLCREINIYIIFHTIHWS